MSSDIDPLPDAVADCSPKAKLAYRHLAEHDSLTCPDLIRADSLPESTAHNALIELLEAGVVERRTDPSNPLAYVYHLTDEKSETNV